MSCANIWLVRIEKRVALPEQRYDTNEIADLQ